MFQKCLSWPCGWRWGWQQVSAVWLYILFSCWALQRWIQPPAPADWPSRSVLWAYAEFGSSKPPWDHMKHEMWHTNTYQILLWFRMQVKMHWGEVFASGAHLSSLHWCSRLCEETELTLRFSLLRWCCGWDPCVCSSDDRRLRSCCSSCSYISRWRSRAERFSSSCLRSREWSTDCIGSERHFRDKKQKVSKD